MGKQKSKRRRKVLQKHADSMNLKQIWDYAKRIRMSRGNKHCSLITEEGTKQKTENKSCANGQNTPKTIPSNNRPSNT